jgi:hypothetical protein
MTEAAFLTERLIDATIAYDAAPTWTASDRRAELFAARGAIEAALTSQALLIERLTKALESIAEDTDPDNPDSYRCDDREGCLDTVQATARAALASAQRALPSKED